MGEYSEAIVLTAAVLGLTYIVKRVIDAVVQIAEQRRATRNAVQDGSVTQRLEQIEASVDAIAIEVERVGELQRFTTRLQQGKPARDLPSNARHVTPV